MISQCMVHGCAGNLKCLEALPKGGVKRDNDEDVEPADIMVVVTRQDLAQAEEAVWEALIDKHQDGGVTFQDPRSTAISLDVTIGRDSVIGMGVQLQGKTAIGRRVCTQHFFWLA